MKKQERVPLIKRIQSAAPPPEYVLRCKGCCMGKFTGDKYTCVLPYCKQLKKIGKNGYTRNIIKDF